MADRRSATLSHIRGQDGFALALAVFAMVVLAAIVAAGYFSASQELNIGRGMKSVTASFYAGESGGARLLEDWEPATYNELAPGEQIFHDPVTLEGGGSYSAIVTRTDNGADPFKRYFYIEITGRPPGYAQGERRQAITARVRFYDLCCDAALTTLGTQGPVQVSNNTTISGEDSAPWGAACSGIALRDTAGIVTGDASTINEDEQGDILPDAPYRIVEDPTIVPGNLFLFDDVDYADLAAMADHVVAGGTTFGNVAPVTNNGECVKTDAQNWGAPNSPTNPCFDYFPVIHVTGDLFLRGNNAGQGIFLVDGNLDTAGPFSLYGIALVQGDLLLGAQTTFAGGAIVQQATTLEATSARLLRSSCAVQRAIRLSSLAKARPLQTRAWVELF